MSLRDLGNIRLSSARRAVESSKYIGASLAHGMHRTVLKGVERCLMGACYMKMHVYMGVWYSQPSVVELED